MSPTAVTPSVEAPPAPPERPGFFAVAVATFLGYFVAAIVLLAVGLVLMLAGVGIVDIGGSAGRGLFYRYDVWSWAAEACAAVLITGLTALLVGSYLRWRTGWEVRFGTIFLTLLATGYAPALALTPLYGATAVVSLVLAALVLRWRARPSGAEPMTALGQVPRHLRRTVAVGLLIAVPLMGAYAVGYALTHPLRFDWNTQRQKRVAHEPGDRMFYEFRLNNTGRPVVSDVELVKTEGSPTIQVERVGRAAPGHVTWDGAAAVKPLSGLELRRDAFDDDRLVLVLRQGAECPTPVARLDALRVRYTVLGMRHEQRIPLVHGPAVVCR